jgi:hypothetical protein
VSVLQLGQDIILYLSHRFRFKLAFKHRIYTERHKELFEMRGKELCDSSVHVYYCNFLFLYSWLLVRMSIIRWNGREYQKITLFGFCTYFCVYFVMSNKLYIYYHIYFLDRLRSFILVCRVNIETL